MNTDYWHPFIPPNLGTFGAFGWSGILRAAAIVFFTYIGFDAVCTVAQETTRPRRNLPLGILGTIGICGALYMLVAAILTGLAPHRALNVAAPFAVALDAHPDLRWLGGFIKVGVITGMTSAIMVTLIAQPRIFLAMANAGLLPPAFGAIHRRFQTPYFGTIVTGAAAAVTAGLLPIQILGELVSIGTLLAYLCVCLGVMMLRLKRPELRRRFRVPAAPVTCTLGAGSCALMLVALPVDTWLRLLIWTALGSVIYLSYGSASKHAQRCATARAAAEIK